MDQYVHLSETGDDILRELRDAFAVGQFGGEGEKLGPGNESCRMSSETPATVAPAFKNVVVTAEPRPPLAPVMTTFFPCMIVSSACGIRGAHRWFHCASHGCPT